MSELSVTLKKDLREPEWWEELNQGKELIRE
jgi:hypothetical protein